VLRKLLSLFRREPPKPKYDDPWIDAIFARLGERYQLAPDGARVLRRTGRARFNPMPVYVDKTTREVRGDYEVRGEAAAARSLLDARVTPRLSQLGLSQASESNEDWAGNVLTRRYAGKCELPEQAAAAVRFICEESEAQVNLAAES
jgi:hypothetical protein